MPNPVEFTATTPRFALPLLFASQFQKEFFVNEAHRLLDALAHPAVEGLGSTPPATPQEGDAWLVTATAQGDWVGQEDKLAAHIGGSWLFVPPQLGMQVYRKDIGQLTFYSGAWGLATEPTTPSGGTTVDVEARNAVSTLIAALRSVGIFAAS